MILRVNRNVSSFASQMISRQKKCGVRITKQLQMCPRVCLCTMRYNYAQYSTTFLKGIDFVTQGSDRYTSSNPRLLQVFNLALRYFAVSFSHLYSSQLHSKNPRAREYQFHYFLQRDPTA